MYRDEIWEEIKKIKHEIELYELAVVKLKHEISDLKEKERMLRLKLPLLWEEFNKLYKEYSVKN